MKLSFIHDVLQRLKFYYGPPQPRRDLDPIDTLIETILSQNTSDNNSQKAFHKLKSKFRNWNDLARASEKTIASLIQHAGLSKIKARYIKNSLNTILKMNGNLKLDFLREMQINEARKWLLNIPGVGLKTANCILLFSFGLSALPVDTHIFRVSKRLGLIDKDLNIEKAHYELEKMVPQNELYNFHLLLISHGRETCKARNPRCEACILGHICNSRPIFTKNSLNLSS